MFCLQAGECAALISIPSLGKQTENCLILSGCLVSWWKGALREGTLENRETCLRFSGVCVSLNFL